MNEKPSYDALLAEVKRLRGIIDDRYEDVRGLPA